MFRCNTYHVSSISQIIKNDSMELIIILKPVYCFMHPQHSVVVIVFQVCKPTQLITVVRWTTTNVTRLHKSWTNHASNKLQWTKQYHSQLEVVYLIVNDKKSTVLLPLARYKKTIYSVTSKRMNARWKDFAANQKTNWRKWNSADKVWQQ